MHPYLVGESEGRSVLDAARAAHGSDGATARRASVLVFGHSQGGQSALFAGELAASYAPELDVLGVAAAAPAADVEHILPLAGAHQTAPPATSPWASRASTPRTPTPTPRRC